jgi:hypothetical protein
MMKFLYSGLMAIAGLLSAGTAEGAIIYTLDAPIQSGMVGDILHFTGTVTNTGPESYSTGFGHSFTGVWPSAFEFTFPFGSGFGNFKPGPGDSYTGELFDILITPAAAGLMISGSSYLYSWPDGSNPQDFSAVQFSNAQAIEVTALVPEPSGATLVLAGVVFLCALHRRARGITVAPKESSACPRIADNFLLLH